MTVNQKSSHRRWKVLQAHNYHAVRGGMEVMFEHIVEMLRSRQHEVVVMKRDNNRITTFRDKLSAFRQALYSHSARAEMAATIRSTAPDIAHFHNLYPLLSPSVLEACRELDVPTVLRCGDYKLTCPTAQHLRNGIPCEACLEGKEYWCALNNCKGNLLASTAYAIRNMTARRSGRIRNNVTVYIVPTRFIKQQLIRGGYPGERIEVLPNMATIPAEAPSPPAGNYVAYVGRISPEKGIETLLEAARATGLPVRIAGDPSPMPQLVRSAPDNVEFVGRLGQHELPAFYSAARVLVVPSVWFEVFGIVCAEAMGHRLPVIASRIGGLPEVLDDGVTGLLFEPGSSEELAEKIELVWNDDALCQRLGDAGRKRAVGQFSTEIYYERLMDLYNRALEMNRRPEHA